MSAPATVQSKTATAAPLNRGGIGPANTEQLSAKATQKIADKQEEIESKKKISDETGMNDDEDVEDEADAMQFETYESSFNKGFNHPDILVQAASLSSVKVPPLTYELKLPDEIYSKGLLSNPQLETVVLACQKHEEKFIAKSELLGMQEFRRGFYLGDGAGVGKGRQVSGIILENLLARGIKRAVWLSASPDLIHDAMRDLEDIGLTSDIMRCVSIKDVGYELAKWKKLDNCVLFVTYTTLVNKSPKLKVERFKRLVDWLGTNFEGCIIFDEGHKAKNLLFKKGSVNGIGLGLLLAGTQAGQCVYRLQDQLPLARIVYCSATGVTTVENFAYMSRLAMWGTDGQSSFSNTFLDFQKMVRDGGIGMMEVLSSYL